MTPEIQQMLARRQRFIKRWPLIALIVTVMTLGFYIWAFMKQPILVNPVHVVHLIQNNALDNATQSLLAIVAPVLFLTIGALLLLLLLFVTVGLINEGRLIRLLEQK
jgi:type II secretory pathway component PulF